MLFAVQYDLEKIFKEIHKQISWLKFQERIKKITCMKVNVGH